MVEHTIRTIDASIPYRAVHASRGKAARTEPVAALDSRGLIHHAGIFGALEDQMCRFDGGINGASPDRVDARTWAFFELMLNKTPPSAPKVWGGRFI